MEYKTILKANIKRHKGIFISIAFLMFCVVLAISTVFSLWRNSGTYIKEEMRRVGFGDITAWVSNVVDTNKLINNITDLEEVSHINVQEIIYTNYSANEIESDSEGQLIKYNVDENKYKFFTDDILKYYETAPVISAGEVYVSPSLISILNIKIGDEIKFPINRQGESINLKVKGYYEDPFMGSSMIGMKGFLISESDYTSIIDRIKASDIDALARDGAMLHLFSEVNSFETIAELNKIINEGTDLPQYTEFIHSENAIYGFMLILQDSFSGLLLVFSLLLLIVIAIIVGHNISNSIEDDYKEIAILKVIGFTSKKIRTNLLIEYLLSIIIGIIPGILFSIPLSKILSSVTTKITGVLIPTSLQHTWVILLLISIILVFATLIIYKTNKIINILPMQSINGEINSLEKFNQRKSFKISLKYMNLKLAFRQLIANKGNYIGVLVVASLLVFLLSFISRVNTWLGPNGEGMMGAFNPADHHLGVQSLSNVDLQEVDNFITDYTDITDSYLLAMPSVVVNGNEYTANVISEPSRFHILDGETSLMDNEVVLTEFVASDLGVEIGDTVTVSGDLSLEEYIVSGIYQCANNMGNNIGMSKEGYLKISADDSKIWCNHLFLSDTSQKSSIIEGLNSIYGGDIHVHENSWPGLYGIISIMKALVVFVYIMAILFILVITTMSGSRILKLEQKDMGIYKAIGFCNKQLRLTFSLRFMIVSILGSIIGSLVAVKFTDSIISFVMKYVGISNFASESTIGNTILPILIVNFIFIGCSYFTSRKIKKTTLTVLISGE